MANEKHDPQDPEPFHAAQQSAHGRRRTPPLYGIMAEFDNPTDLVAAARSTYEAGYRRINGYSPYPIEELSEPWFTLPLAFDCLIGA